MLNKLLITVALAAALGGCQTLQPVANGGNSFGLQTDGDCIVRQVPVYDAQSGTILDIARRYCGNKVGLTQ
jgi:hypothetical protein